MMVPVVSAVSGQGRSQGIYSKSGFEKFERSIGSKSLFERPKSYD